MGGCSAPDCHSSTKKGCRLFSFPTDDVRKRLWLANCRRRSWCPTTNSRLCEKHFEESQFESHRADGWRKLKPYAVPTIFENIPRWQTSDPPILKRPSEISDGPTPKIARREHDYAKVEGAKIGCSRPRISMPSTAVFNTATEGSKNISTIFREDMLPIACDVEVSTVQISSAEHFQLWKNFQNLKAKNKQLENQIKNLKRRLQISERKNLILEKKVDKIFNNDQLQALQRVTKGGVSWSKETVQRSLQMMFACGPTGYQLLRDFGHPIPAPRTLRKSIEVVQFNGGILKEVFELLQLKVAQMTSEKEKLCCLTLDEMSISPAIEYDLRTGRLMGEITLPGHSGKATKAMVFMLAGISTRWKQTVAYYFTGNSVCGSVLKPIITNIITQASHTGLRVIAVTCDMSSCNQAMWRSFGITCGNTSIPHPVLADQKLYFMADAPHLIKNLKAALVNGQDIMIPDKIVKENHLSSAKVSASHLRQLLKFQENLQCKISPGLTERTLAPGHFDKMKVSNAMSFFSHSNSAGLEYLVKVHQFNNDLMTTAWFIKAVNRWFDLVSSRRQVTALSHKNPIRYKETTDFLFNFIHLFQTLSIGKKSIWKPVQTGIIMTTRSILDVSSHLLDDGFGFVLTSRFTSDCIENLFSCVRTNNPVPTPLEFKNKLRLLSVAQFLKVKASSSYSNDSGNFLADFLHKQQVSSPAAEDLAEGLSFTDVISLPNSELNSLYYLAGYIVSRVLKYNRTCDKCSTSITLNHTESSEDHAVLLQLKSYKDGCLTSCSKEIFDLIKKSETVFRSVSLNTIHHTKNVKRLLLDEIHKSSSDILFPDCHKIKDVVLRRFVTFRLRIWAKDQSARLKASLKEAGMGSKSVAMRIAVSKFK